MEIGKIDKNLASLNIGDERIDWYNVKDEKISVHGAFFDEKEGLYLRIPDEVAKSVNAEIDMLNRMTAGARARLVTNSPFIAIKATLPAFMPMPHMSITGSHGFSVYANGSFSARYSPCFNNFPSKFDNPYGEKVIFAEKKPIYGAKGKCVIDIYFPLYGGVFDIFVGVMPGAVIEKAPSYKITKPLVFYGSSVTQGACVSRPGNDYVSILARRLDADFINLGFSGNGNAEAEMIDYINGIDASLFAFDYNYYPSKAKSDLPPHYSIYERIRKAHPDTPILIYDKPGVDFEPSDYRRDTIRETYERAIAEGDRKIAYVSGEALLGNGDRDACMVDCSHPNDLGAMRMADNLYPIIKSLLI